MAETPEEKSYGLFNAANGVDFLTSPDTHALLLKDQKLAARLEKTAETISRVESNMNTQFDRPVFLLDTNDWHFGTVIGPCNDVKSYLKLDESDGKAFLGSDSDTLKSVLQLPLSALKDDSTRAPNDIETAIAHELGHAVNKRVSDSLTELELLSDEIATTSSVDWFGKTKEGLQVLLASAPRDSKGEITPESLLEGIRENGEFLAKLNTCGELKESPFMKMMSAFISEPETAKIDEDSRAKLLDSVNGLMKNLNHALEFSSDDFALRYNPEGSKQANHKLMQASNASYYTFSHPASDTRVVRVELLDETRQKLLAKHGIIDEDAAVKHTNYAMGNVRDATEKMASWKDRYETEKATKPSSPTR